MNNIQKVHFFLFVHVELAESGDDVEKDFLFEDGSIVPHFSELNANLIHGLKPMTFLLVFEINLLDMLSFGSGGFGVDEGFVDWSVIL